MKEKKDLPVICTHKTEFKTKALNRTHQSI